MSGTQKLLDKIQIDLRCTSTGDLLPVYIDVYDSNLSRKWLAALNDLLRNNYHLEKNYCFFGWLGSDRHGDYLCDQINASIKAINEADIGYKINDWFSVANTLLVGEVGDNLPGRKLIHDKMNHLHRYFEDLQGQSGRMSEYFNRADATTRWHIRQLNLLCHEYESWALSYRKEHHAQEWRRPSQLMCWLHAPRFLLEDADYELFGIDSINRPLGGVFVGVNKSVGKHHWEVFIDEVRDQQHAIDELTTSTLISQTEAAGDFDIEWANNPGEYHWQKQRIAEFREWLIKNGFDPEDKKLTIGHPQVGQVDLQRSFGSTHYQDIWTQMTNYLDVYRVSTSDATATYDYHWSDEDFIERQVAIISRGR